MARLPRQSASPAASVQPVVAPVAYRSLAGQIASSIRDAIAQGRIPPGSRLVEPSLAKTMGTSRAPIREALSLLEREGLVIKTPNRGARVVELTEQTVREVGSVRGLLEGFAASLAATRMPVGQLTELEEIVAEMDRAGAERDYSRLVEMDYQFHATICRASGHQTLYETWSAMSGKIRLYLSATNLMYRDMKAIGRGHREVLDALRARDGAWANRAMQEHLGERLNQRADLLTRQEARKARTSAIFRESRRMRRLAVARLGTGRIPRGGRSG